NCNNAQLTDAAATSFYVVVPAATYAKGLQFMIYNETGALINSLITTQALTINRSKVAKMPEKTMVATVHFPDPKFRAELVRKYGLKLTPDKTDIDVNNGDNKTIFTSQKEIRVENSRIASLKGIEYFTGLNTLYCFRNELTSLDVSKNTAIDQLYCSENQLTSLDVSQNTALIWLFCSENQLTDLDVSKNTKLTSLGCQENQLKSLDVTKNTALTSLDCNTNQLTSLDLSQNTALTSLNCNTNQMTSLDLSKNTKLNSLFCYENQLTSLDIRTCSMLTKLACGNQHADGGTGETYTDLKLLCLESQKALISKPDDAAFNKNVIFERVAFPDPKFRAVLVSSYELILTTDGDIDVNDAGNKAKFASRTYIDVSYKQIASLQGIEYFTGLTQLSCHANQLTSL
ncbi:MAG: hypothetical protein RR522_04670, partial [Alistipes sp.]